MAKRKSVKSEEVVNEVALENVPAIPEEKPARRSRKVKTEQADPAITNPVVDEPSTAAIPVNESSDVSQEQPEPFRIAAVPPAPKEDDASVIQLVSDNDVSATNAPVSETGEEPEPFRVVDVPPNSVAPDDSDDAPVIRVPQNEKRKDEGYLRINKPKLGMLMVNTTDVTTMEALESADEAASDSNDEPSDEDDVHDNDAQDMDDFMVVHRHITADDEPQDNADTDDYGDDSNDSDDVDEIPDDMDDEPDDDFSDGVDDDESKECPDHPSCLDAPALPVFMCNPISDLPFIQKSSTDKCYLVPEGKDGKIRFERSYMIKRARPYGRDSRSDIEDTCIADMPYYRFDGHVVGMAHEFDPVAGMYSHEVYTTRGVYAFRTRSELSECPTSYDAYFQTLLNSTILYDAMFLPINGLDGYDDFDDRDCDDISVVCMGVLEVCGVRYGMRSDCPVDFESVIRALWEIINADDSDEDLGFYRAYFKRFGD